MRSVLFLFRPEVSLSASSFLFVIPFRPKLLPTPNRPFVTRFLSADHEVRAVYETQQCAPGAGGVGLGAGPLGAPLAAAAILTSGRKAQKGRGETKVETAGQNQKARFFINTHV